LETSFFVRLNELNSRDIFYFPKFVEDTIKSKGVKPGPFIFLDKYTTKRFLVRKINSGQLLEIRYEDKETVIRIKKDDIFVFFPKELKVEFRERGVVHA
jgi:hypothetical protein